MPDPDLGEVGEYDRAAQYFSRSFRIKCRPSPLVLLKFWAVVLTRCVRLNGDIYSAIQNLGDLRRRIEEETTHDLGSLLDHYDFAQNFSKRFRELFERHRQEVVAWNYAGAVTSQMQELSTSFGRFLGAIDNATLTCLKKCDSKKDQGFSDLEGMIIRLRIEDGLKMDRHQAAVKDALDAFLRSNEMFEGSLSELDGSTNEFATSILAELQSLERKILEQIGPLVSGTEIKE